MKNKDGNSEKMNDENGSKAVDFTVVVPLLTNK